MSAFILSLLVSLGATFMVVVFSTDLAWRFAQGRASGLKSATETVLMLPMVLPPTVVGYALLGMFGNATAFGQWLNGSLGLHLLFTWQAAVIAASVMSFPLYFRSAVAAFRDVDSNLIELGKTLGATHFQMLRCIAIPLASRGLYAGIALAFARALGEFGATMMVAGSIPNRTQTMPLALYSAVFSSKDGEALRLALTLTTTSFILLGVLALLERRSSSERSP